MKCLYDFKLLVSVEQGVFFGFFLSSNTRNFVGLVCLCTVDMKSLHTPVNMSGLCEVEK